MSLADILDPSRVAVVDRPVADRAELLGLLAELLAVPPVPGVAAADVLEALLEREKLASTAVGDGLAFPHAKLAGLPAARAAVALLPEPGVDLGAADGGTVRVAVAVVVPPDSVGEHLKMLGVFSRRLRAPECRRALLAASDAAAVVRIIGGVDAD